MRAAIFTSNSLCAISKLLDVFFREHSQHDHAVETLLEALLRLFKSLGIDEPAINLRPSGTWTLPWPVTRQSY